MIVTHLLRKRLGRLSEHIRGPGRDILWTDMSSAVDFLRCCCSVLSDQPEYAGPRFRMADLVQATRKTGNDLDWGEGVRREGAGCNGILLLLQADLDEGLEHEDGVRDDHVCRMC